MYTYAATALVAIALGFGSGWKVRDWKASADQAAQAERMREDEIAAREAQDRAATSYETKRAAGQQRQRVITREVDRVVEVYRDRPCLTDDGLRLVAQAVAGADPASSPQAAMPAASGAR